MYNVYCTIMFSLHFLSFMCFRDAVYRCGLFVALLNEFYRMQAKNGQINIVDTVMVMKQQNRDYVTCSVSVHRRCPLLWKRIMYLIKKYLQLWYAFKSVHTAVKLTIALLKSIVLLATCYIYVLFTFPVVFTISGAVQVYIRCTFRDSETRPNTRRR